MISHYYNTLVETISKDVLLFSVKLCERKLISNDVNSEMASMGHIAGREKADILMKKAISDLGTSNHKEEWFHKFTAIFSATEVTERLEDFYLGEFVA